MPIDLASQKAEILCALTAAALVTAWRVVKSRSFDVDVLMGSFEAFFGGALFPVSVALIGYPFFEKPPDLSKYLLYLPFAGIGLLFMGFTGIRRSLRSSAPGTASSPN